MRPAPLLCLHHCACNATTQRPYHIKAPRLTHTVLELADFTFSENGLMAHKGTELLAVQSLKDHLGEPTLKKLINFVLRYVADLDIPIKRGTFIEFRSGMLNISPIGRNCSQQERTDFEAYDATANVRCAFAPATVGHELPAGLNAPRQAPRLRQVRVCDRQCWNRMNNSPARLNTPRKERFQRPARARVLCTAPWPEVCAVCAAARGRHGRVVRLPGCKHLHAGRHGGAFAGLQERARLSAGASSSVTIFGPNAHFSRKT